MDPTDLAGNLEGTAIVEAASPALAFPSPKAFCDQLLADLRSREIRRGSCLPLAKASWVVFDFAQLRKEQPRFAHGSDI